MDTTQFKKKIASGFLGFWVENRRISFLAILLILGLGIMSLVSIPKESTPDIKFGIIAINTVYLGVNPTDIDQLITDEIEQQIKDISGIKKMSSSSRVGISSVTLELENDASVKDVMIEVKDELDKINFPTEAEDPLVIEISSDNEAMFDLILYADKEISSPAFLKQQARIIKDALNNFGNISSISIQGGDDFDVQLILDKAKIEQMGLSLSQITNTIRAFNQNIPLGNYQVGDLSYDFRIQGELDSVFDLLELPIIGTASQIRMQDIAEINYEYDDESIRTYGEYKNNGYYSTRLTFNKQIGADIFSSSAEAKAAIEELMQTQAFATTSYAYTMDMSETIKEDYATLATSGIQTLVFVFICLVFFVGFKESFIATLAIPLAFLITFIYLNNSGSSLNFMTNFSLVLTLGIAIDTTIVIIEGASEKLKLGYNPKSAILLAVRDYHKPLIAGTMTTLVVFIPMMVLPGIIGKFLSYIPITVFATLVAALFISLTLNSALFYKLSKKGKTYHREPKIEQFMAKEDLALLAEEREGKIEQQGSQRSFRERLLDKLNDGYESLLRKFIKSKTNRRLSVIVPVIVLFFTFMLNTGFTLFPQSDNGFFAMTVSAQVGTRTAIMEQYVPYIEQALKDEPEVKSYTTQVIDNTINVSVDLLDKSDRKKQKLRDVFAVESGILEELQILEEQGLKVASLVEGGGPPGAKPVGVKLVAADSSQFNQLLEVANEFEAFLRTIEGTKNAAVSSEPTPGQFVFAFDHNKLEALGLTPNDITRELSAAINGVGAGSVKVQGEDRDIKVLYEDFVDNVSPSDIENLTINTMAGPLVVGEVLDYSIDNAVGEIAREDGKILVRVDADVADGYVGEGPRMQAEFIERVESYEFPSGISYDVAGEQQENADLIGAAMQGLFISLFTIFGILVLQFNSFSKPVIIMYSVICALLGVNIGLWATGNPYSMAFGIGFIALTGIVVNDAIILIDRINQNISKDVDTAEAIIEAGRSRLQPIILTTLTTLLGVLPIALQDKFWEGLGFTMIFGLFAGSAMTLFVIPSLYHIVFVKHPGATPRKPRYKRIFSRKKAVAPKPDGYDEAMELI